TAEHLALASRVALAELLLSGCTTTADHHYLFPEGLEQAIDIQVEAVRELGMRATLCRGSLSLAKPAGGRPYRRVEQRPEVILADSERLIDRYHQRDRKSTRLNSSHVKISYAVFCLKKKKDV